MLYNYMKIQKVINTCRKLFMIFLIFLYLFISELKSEMNATNLPQVVTVQPIGSEKDGSKGKLDQINKILNLLLILTTLDSKPQLYESFHESVGPVLYVAHFFGLMPCENVLNNDENKLEFKWKSPRTIYALFFLIFTTIECIVGCRRMIRLGLYNVHFVESFLFFTTAVIKFLIMFQLGKKWKKIMIRWRSYENVFLQHPYEFHGMRLKHQVRWVASFFIIFVLGELLNIFNINLIKFLSHQSSTFFSSSKQWTTIDFSLKIARQNRLTFGRTFYGATVLISFSIFPILPSSCHFMK